VKPSEVTGKATGDAAEARRIARRASETRRLGERLGRVARAGDVIALLGTLGAGKTCFTQGLALGLGVPPDERVASPTFTIVSEHAGRVPLYHIDLYRLGDEGELAEIGLEGYLGGDGVAAVEWMDRFPRLAPADHLEVRLALDADARSSTRRVLTARATGPRSSSLLAAWLPAPRAPARRS